VTGASDGIGKEYALQLSRAGYSTLLVSRTASKLDALAAEIKSKFNTQTKTLAMDFGANNDEDYAKLKALVDGLDIAILINNVGRSHSIPVPFMQTSQEEMESIIMINCLATLRVTQLVAVGMTQRRRGLILTMASFGGVFPTPLLATYSGSKAFLQQWSTALGSELAPYNISVEVVQSYLVTSAMSKIRRSSMLVPTPRAFVKSVLGKVGRTGGAQGWAYTSTPYWSHAVMQWAVAAFVSPGNGLLLGYNKWAHNDIRRRALAKQQRNSGKKGV
jgi:17beta-estradiol 17-dehydrogenase / very-long-chain 3-oxoacyl-CoA reductase